MAMATAGRSGPRGSREGLFCAREAKGTGHGPRGVPCAEEHLGDEFRPAARHVWVVGEGPRLGRGARECEAERDGAPA